MKQQIRVGVFETNSSSEHSACITKIGGTILTEEEFALYEAGELRVSPIGEVTTPEDYKAMRELVHEQAGKEWDEDRRRSTSWRTCKTRKDYIAYWLDQYDYDCDVKRHVRYDEFMVETFKREINGKIYYAVSFAEAELD